MITNEIDRRLKKRGIMANVILSCLLIGSLVILCQAVTVATEISRIDISKTPTINVPNIENLTEIRAEKILKANGLAPRFERCFSNLYNKGTIIPGSQNPKGGSEITYSIGEKIGATVNAKVSIGPFPNLIGLSLEDSIKRLNEININCTILDGRNESFPIGYIYHQSPKEAECISSNFKITLYNNSPLQIKVLTPQNLDRVTSTVVVRGILSSDLYKNEHLWIAVKPFSSIMNWWPQAGGPIEPSNREFEGAADLGGNNNDTFEIAILIVGDELNDAFKEWENASSRFNQWIPITQKNSITNKIVPKDLIEKSKYAKVIVTLDNNANSHGLKHVLGGFDLFGKNSTWIQVDDSTWNVKTNSTIITVTIPKDQLIYG